MQSLAALIESFCGTHTVSFSAQFASRCRRSRALLTRAWLGFRQFLAAAGEAGFPDGDAGVTGAFGATLAVELAVFRILSQPFGQGQKFGETSYYRCQVLTSSKCSVETIALFSFCCL